jgi:hypothetical protein
MVTSATFASVPAIGSGTFTATASTALLRIEVIYGGELAVLRRPKSMRLF